MATVGVSGLLDASVHEAQGRWCDVSRWPEWVNGLAKVVAVQGDWPQVGSIVTWESGPAGRGRVVERVTEYEPLAGMTVSVEDQSLEGSQRVTFDPVPEGVEVRLTLEYRLKRRAPWTPILEWFIRRPMTISLTRTLLQFKAGLETSRTRSLG